VIWAARTPPIIAGKEIPKRRRPSRSKVIDGSVVAQRGEMAGASVAEGAAALNRRTPLSRFEERRFYSAITVSIPVGIAGAAVRPLLHRGVSQVVMGSTLTQQLAKKNRS